MSPIRFRLALLAGVALLGGAAVAPAQTPIERLLAPYKKARDFTADSSEQLQNLKDGTYAVTDPKGVVNAKARTAVEEKAQELVFRVTWAEYHETVKKGEDTLVPRNANKTVDQIVADIRGQFITQDARLTANQVDFHREFGAALFDAVLLVMTDKNPPQLLRLNAARLLPVVAETASPAVGRGLLKLLGTGVFKDADKKPVAAPPDVLLYVIRACETFFDRYNVPKPGEKDLRPEEYAALISAVVKMVESAPPVMGKVAPQPPSADARATAEAAKAAAEAVHRYYRLQAIRALGKLRADFYPDGADGIRPLFTLAKVAVSDPSIKPAPSPKEVGEATLGLMAAQLGPDANADELAYVVSEGTAAFFAAYARRNVDPDAKAVDWNASAAQFQAALKAWRRATVKNRQIAAQGQKAVADLAGKDVAPDKSEAGKIETEVLSPLIKPAGVDNAPNVNALREWQNEARAQLPGTLFNDAKNKTKYKVYDPKR